MKFGLNSCEMHQVYHNEAILCVVQMVSVVLKKESSTYLHHMILSSSQFQMAETIRR